MITDVEDRSMVDDAAWEGPERRSAESLLARELVVVKAQARRYEDELGSRGRLSLRRRRKARRSLEIARERERQILETLGGNSTE
jgi:hypothetical protein